MAIALLTRHVRFSAAHRYHRPEWTEERNRATFGPCANPHGHGHLYRLEVTVAGTVDETTGFAVDLAELDALLRRSVTDVFDHRNINEEVEAFRDGGLVPTTENLVRYLWPILEDGLPEGVALHRLRLHEDDALYTDYYGGGVPG